MANLVNISTRAGDARMHKDVAPRFEKLRTGVLAASGVDFLAVCGDVLRPADYRSRKSGVANRSWHKTGRAFDYDQTSSSIVIVGEAVSGKQFFRTYLKCVAQDGSQGTRRQVRDMRGFSVNAYLVDFTELAEAAGFIRIPAWAGWRRVYNQREFWHYQRADGNTWDVAMQQIKGGAVAAVKAAVKAGRKIIGLNDRDSNTDGRVTEIQRRLSSLGLLAGNQVDGVFGAFTKAGVLAFQRRSGIGVDGDVGPQTAAALGVEL